MGSDIHFYIEKKKRDGKWHLAECHEIYHAEDDPSWLEISNWSPGRNYYFFGMLADVRGSSGRNTVPERGVPEDASPMIKTLMSQWRSDAHSASHCSISEYEKVCDEADLNLHFLYNSSRGWREMLRYASDWLYTEAAEAAILGEDYEPDVRFIYFFDN